MKKDKPIKIRRTWDRHPAERIKENKERKEQCESCDLWRTDPEACVWCDVEYLNDNK